MRVQCQLCGIFYNRISDQHLAKHNITPEEYEIKYGPRTQASRNALKKVGGEAFLAAISEQSPEKLSEVMLNDSRIFSGKERSLVMEKAYKMLEAAHEQYLLCHKVMLNFLNQMLQPWALTQNEDGSPLSAIEKSQLMRVVQSATRDIAAFQARIMQQIMSDNHTFAMRKEINRIQEAFSGAEDKIPAFPDTMSPYQREKIRQLLEAIDKGMIQGASSPESLTKMVEEQMALAKASIPPGEEKHEL